MRQHNVLTRLGGRWQEPGPAQRALRLMLVALLVLPQAVAPATITVVGTDSTVAMDSVCSLREAIDNANDDAPTHVDCVAGSGADTVSLTADVTLTLVDDNLFEDLGLPVISTDVTIDGGFTIARDSTAPAFGIFAVDSSGTLNLNDTTVSGGFSAGVDSSGGGILVFYGTANLTNSTVSGNSATDGGGIMAFGGTANLANSTVSGNYAFFGGGIGGGTLTLTNSTVSGNSATFGGGIASYRTTTLTNSTVSGNYGSFGGGIYNDGGTATLINSIVANSLAGGDCFILFGAISDGGNNFSGDLSCPGSSAITPGTDFDTTLAANGGPTETHALLAGSVAIDAAGACSVATDQRGVARPAGFCDSGSYEFGGSPDSDGDGVLDTVDVCPGTAIPEAVPTRRFGKNRWALMDGTDFEQAPPQAGSKRSFTTTDTGGCSCEQIVAVAGLGGGHLKFGCSTSVMLAWVELVNS
ncbi:MAG: right-handed parallel beta-helix repeat-containing protein [Thermoanaerobaculia bacterium]